LILSFSQPSAVRILLLEGGLKTGALVLGAAGFLGVALVAAGLEGFFLVFLFFGEKKEALALAGAFFVLAFFLLRRNFPNIKFSLVHHIVAFIFLVCQLKKN
jgi:hypothetical protein